MYNIMSLLSFEEIQNGKWYIIPGFYVDDEPDRIYKTTYNNNSYIKSISHVNQQEIVKVPSNEKIFMELDENDVDDIDDMDDLYDSDDERYLKYLEFDKFKFF